MNITLDKIYSLLLSGFGSQKMEDIGFFPFLILLLISLLCSMLVSYLYLKFYKNRATGSQIHRAFPLLGVAITAIFICIQFSLPLSLGLLGALSIVRFRTPIKEPEEIGFIMIVVATSICCATFNVLFLAIILMVTYIGLLIMQKGPSFLKGRLNDGMIILTVPLDEYRTLSVDILNHLEKTFPNGKIDSISENNDSSVVSFSFTRMHKDIPATLSNEIKNISNNIQTNIFFNRIGDI